LYQYGVLYKGLVDQPAKSNAWNYEFKEFLVKYFAEKDRLETIQADEKGEFAREVAFCMVTDLWSSPATLTITAEANHLVYSFLEVFRMRSASVSIF
jgi:hypothetical protein